MRAVGKVVARQLANKVGLLRAVAAEQGGYALLDAGAGGGRGVALADAEERRDEHADQAVGLGRALAVGLERKERHRLGQASHHLAELVGQARLADAGGADNGNKAGGAALDHAVELVEQLLQLFVAADQGRADPGDLGGRKGRCCCEGACVAAHGVSKRMLYYWPYINARRVPVGTGGVSGRCGLLNPTAGTPEPFGPRSRE